MFIAVHLDGLHPTASARPIKLAGREDSSDTARTDVPNYAVLTQAKYRTGTAVIPGFRSGCGDSGNIAGLRVSSRGQCGAHGSRTDAIVDIYPLYKKYVIRLGS